tara:strand:- start:27108 stop:27299 length:192 start_codon:yes stop_codon:yes gene_type:complete
MSKQSQIESLQKCRDIKNEIIKFGINQTELKHLIKILALELEDTTLMKDIVNLFKTKEEKLNV